MDPRGFSAPQFKNPTPVEKPKSIETFDFVCYDSEVGL